MIAKLTLPLRRLRLAVLPQEALRLDQGMWLLATAVVTLVPHFRYFPFWVSTLCVVVLLWRGVLLWLGRRPPNRLLLILFGLGCTAGIKFNYGYFFGKEPGLALLGLLLALKLLESGSSRDIRAGILLCFFLQLGLFFNDQSVLVGMLALAGCLLAIVSMLALADMEALTRERLKTATILLGQSLPFMLLLFVLFPRFDSPLWGLPSDARARTGLSDTMELGGISSLGLSEEIAFRAKFEGALPEPAIRYWRGPVLTRFDGKTWRPAPMHVSTTPFYVPGGRSFEYQMTLEPHHQHWLLGMDFSVVEERGVRYTDNFLLLLQRPLGQRARFTLLAYPDVVVGVEEQTDVLEEALRLPAGVNPRTVQLVPSLIESAATSEEIVQLLLNYLRDNGFVYTLDPPSLGEHSIDEFIFDTRRGFCEHFAAAFVFMMRVAKVPARVVTGYQGGELNPVDGHLVIRQSDAHAWAEVWLEKRGWIRVDPTAQAAPRRIEAGLASALPPGSTMPFLMNPALRWLHQFRYRWDAFSNAWNQWVLGYDFTRQQALLEQIGMQNVRWSMLVWGIAIGSFVLFGLLIGWALLKRYKQSPLERIWIRFSVRMGRLGYERRPAEGPLDYGRRLALAMPDHADVLLAICADYARLRYRPPASSAEVSRLVQRVKKLKMR